MAIGAILAPAPEKDGLGIIKVNKGGKYDPKSLGKGDIVTFTYEQGGGIELGSWVKVAVTGTEDDGYYASGALEVHDCPVSRATDKKGIILVKKSPSDIQKHPVWGVGMVATSARQQSVAENGDFVRFDIPAAGVADPVIIHTCPHAG